MQRGATLLELALVMAIIGLTLTIALPRIGVVADGLAVQRAAQELVAAHRRARVTAVLRSQIIELVVGADSLLIRPQGSAVPLWHAGGPADGGVALAGPRRVITFSPVGLTTGLSNATFQLSRGTATRSVIVSRLGRVRVTP